MISVTLLTKNSEETLERTLRSVAPFQEVVLLDTGSNDSTLDIAKKFSNVKIYQRDFEGFGKAHNLATSLASYDWIFSVDSDEVVTESLYKEISSLPLDDKCIYAVLRHNYFNGKHIKGCAGWHPDWVIRLYNRKKTSFTEDAVHEKVKTGSLTTVRLRGPLQHYPYRQVNDFLQKMQDYSTLFAKQHCKKKQASLFKALLHGWFAFFKSYVLKRGFIAGKEGLVISLYNGHTAFYKYLKLKEINNK